MVVENAEPETAQTLEGLLASSPDVEEVSEEEEEENTELEAVKVKDEEKEEPPDKFESRVQAEADKRTGGYREKREADTALIRKQDARIKELERQTTTKNSDKLMSLLLDGYDEEGNPPEKKEDFTTNLKKINQKVDEYNEKFNEVNGAAQFIGDVVEKLPSEAVKVFGLDDANPAVRVKNYAKFLNEAIFAFSYNSDFLMVVEKFLPKGDQLRGQIDKLIAEMEGETKKGKELIIKNELKGLKLTPRKKPPTPSDSSGGIDMSQLSPREKINKGIEKLKQK